MHHGVPVFANKHTYIVPSYRQTTFSQKIFTGLSENSFQKKEKKKKENLETISDTHYETRTLSPAIQCWLQIEYKKKKNAVCKLSSRFWTLLPHMASSGLTQH